MVIGNEDVACVNPKNPGGYDEKLQPGDSAFNRSKVKEKNARKVLEHEQFLRVKERISQLNLQVVEKPHLEALKESFIGYCRRTPSKMVQQKQFQYY